MGAGGAIFSQGTVVLDGVTLTNNIAQGGQSGLTTLGYGGGGIGQDAPAGENGGGFGGSFPGGTGGSGGASGANDPGGGSGGGGGGGGFRSQDAGQSSTNATNGAGGGLGGLGGGGNGGGAGSGGDGGGGGNDLSGVGEAGGGFGSGGAGNGGFGGGGGGGIGGGGGDNGGGGFGGGGGGSLSAGFGGDGGFGGGGGGDNGGGGFGAGGGNFAFGADGGFGGGAGTGTAVGTTIVGGGGAGLGGAVFNHRGLLIVVNSTFTANSALGGLGVSLDGTSGGGGGLGAGGAIFNLNGSVSLTNDTLSGDTASGGAANVGTGAQPGQSLGWEVYNLAFGNQIEDGAASTAMLALANTILANGTNELGNISDLVNQSINGKNINTATVNITAPSIIQSAPTSFGGTITGTPIITNPLLGSLGNNGGPTQTMAPAQLFSPAINAGSNLFAINASDNPLTTDQRGLPRILDGTVDIGAVESPAQPPTASTSGPTAGVRYQPEAFTFSASDPVAALSQAGFTYTINWGDGSPAQTVQATANNGSGVSATHQYTTAGTFTVSVTATNQDGTISNTATQTISIFAAALLGDPLHPGQNALFIGGTAGSDTIRLRQVGNSYALAIKTTGGSAFGGSFAGPVSRIVIYTGDGNDTVRFNANVLVGGWIYAGAGNDNLEGAPDAANVIVGGSGNSLIRAGARRDIIIGGSGSERLDGGTSQDLVIAGTTAFDQNEAALNALQLEWNARRSYAARVANLRGTGSGAHNNGNFFLVAAGANETVFGSDKGNTLTSGTGQDWFFAKVSGNGVHDALLQRTPSETVDRLA
jgi:hypothetical protein